MMEVDLTTPVDNCFAGMSAFPESPMKQMYESTDELEETMPMGSGSVFARNLFGSSGELTQSAPPILDVPGTPRKGHGGARLSMSCLSSPCKTPSRGTTPKHRRVLSVDFGEQQRINPFSPSGVPQGLDDPRASPMSMPALSPMSTHVSQPKQPNSKRMEAFKLWSQESVSITPGSRRRSRRGSEDLLQTMLPSTDDTTEDDYSCFSHVGMELQYSKQQATVYEDDLCTVWRVVKKLDGMLACITIVKTPVTPANEEQLLCQVQALLALQNNGIGYQDCWKERLTKNGQSFQRLYILTDCLYTFDSVAINGASEEMVYSMAESVCDQLKVLHDSGIVHNDVSLNSVVATSGRTLTGTTEFKLGIFSKAAKSDDPTARKIDFFLLGITVLEALNVLPSEFVGIRGNINPGMLPQLVSFASRLDLNSLISSDVLRDMTRVLLSVQVSVLSQQTHRPTEYECILRCNLQQLESELRSRQLQHLFPLHRQCTVPLIQLTQASPIMA
eukprot:TRINITY_DN2033_c6_g1_i1.p1 TRINITY_DN2033_c6_g1~~TRINITY_DN2033_c6_g1_i1.p1  ORF type:complete len:520 (+),score=98.51 TRINITY_DN2033_c6_g1_i1:55-1560(+)